MLGRRAGAGLGLGYLWERGRQGWALGGIVAGSDTSVRLIGAEKMKMSWPSPIR